jgi:hypothetical protein
MHGMVFQGMAQADLTEENDLIVKLQKAGWKIVQDGVLRRESRPNEVETFVFGEAGFSWKLWTLRSQLQVLQREFQARPTPELRKTIASHRKLIASTLKMVERAGAADTSEETKVLKAGCVPTITYSANASYKTNRRDTWTDAVAEFKVPEGCGSSGEVYAYAFAKTSANGTLSTTTMSDGPRVGSKVRASAAATRNGEDLCDSYAYASVTSYTLVPTSYSISQTNNLCPAAPASRNTTPGTAQEKIIIVPVDDSPVAVNDTATIGEDSGANAINVLVNDTDVDGGPKSVASVTQPANGTVVITGGGTGLTYTPNTNYCNSVSGPPDTFTYTLTPGGSTATVSVTVTCAHGCQ